MDFWVWVQATDRLGSFVLKSELMIALHERFGKEGIEINYPVRKLIIAAKPRAFNSAIAAAGVAPAQATVASIRV